MAFDHEHPTCSHCHGETPVADAPGEVPDGALRTRLRIVQMDCPTEEALLRKKLGGRPGIHALEFNLMERVLAVVHEPGLQPGIEAAIRSLGMTPEALEAPGAPPERKWPWSLALGALAALASEGAALARLPGWAAPALALGAVAACGLGTYRKGWISLRNGEMNINALMSIAVTGAMALREWPEAAMVMVLFALAERIEALSLDRARNAIHGLLRLSPATATVLGPGGWTETEARAVRVGDRVRVGPGEAIPLDGTVVSGRSSVNQAPITGESLPVDKGEGDPVFAGTLNLTGSFEFTVTAGAGGTTLARIIHAVEEAQESRSPTHRFVDRFAKVYTPAVLAVALAVALAPPLLMGGAWSLWVYRALVLLVIACPCALVISTPVTIVSGLAAATRHGILVKGGRWLEEGRNLEWIAFDKTGTLTWGRPVLTDFEPLAMDGDGAWRVATSLASRSDHPVSRALVRPGAPRAEVEDFRALPGQGVQGTLDGTVYSLGNHHLIEELGVCSPELEARLEALERQGKTTLLLTDGRTVLALFALADEVRPGSRDAVAALHALGVRTLMLTGDNTHTAKSIAAQVGILEALGDQLPQDKARAIRSKGGKVGMVGDGINDGPALAAAHIGFAMGAAGSDTAIETADVALMDDDLGKIARFIRLSRDTRAVLAQNIVLAIGIKTVFLGLTIAGRGTMWMAVFADMGASLLVVFNGLRLLRR
ncbi:heavy metal translocating P-type ATPase [Mesoterricola silvestris]|uniref:Heavy metal resistance membrane ATPase n=1 Tax=Mesoterricola silvestris TaxID=2927979 RepID=A0AA48GJ02_9BACT|nr:heavy metal translocating P-type ATPase [Mesoterricola silvestris]BDU71964.1 heavy metal resistance membrane ATPase [Mesoterricola silvestris]